jgi:hypothetical protein
MSRLQGADDRTVTTILPSTTVTFPSLGGSATYSGTAVATTDRVTWTITSTGTAGNPQRKQTLKQTAIVRGLVPGADLGSWSRFYDRDVRFDDDGQLVHYQGRGLIYAAGDVEFDEMVCAGGTGTSQSCVNSISSWDPTKNYLTLMANGNPETRAAPAARASRRTA